LGLRWLFVVAGWYIIGRQSIFRKQAQERAFKSAPKSRASVERQRRDHFHNVSDLFAGQALVGRFHWLKAA
jgi:hypothetical protein